MINLIDLISYSCRYMSHRQLLADLSQREFIIGNWFLNGFSDLAGDSITRKKVACPIRHISQSSLFRISHFIFFLYFLLIFFFFLWP